jgi:hypothetical protein
MSLHRVPPSRLMLTGAILAVVAEPESEAWKALEN